MLFHNIILLFRSYASVNTNNASSATDLTTLHVKPIWEFCILLFQKRLEHHKEVCNHLFIYAIEICIY